MKKILIIAGEASSDMHAANLVNQICSKDKGVSFFGLGGENMKNANVYLLENIVQFAFIGPAGLFKHYIKLKNIYNNLRNYIKKHKPDCAILIDYAEFNLRVAKELKKLNVPIIYYISPQVWAWGQWRIRTIRNLVDKMLVFFKFEEALYKRNNIDATFVGHPLLDIVTTSENSKETRRRLNIDEQAVCIGILPGSRENEIEKILPVILKSCVIINKDARKEKIKFILPLASTIKEETVSAYLKDYKDLDIKIVKEFRHEAIKICECAIVASGTATLETALLDVPMAIVYKVNLLTFYITRLVIKLSYIGLVNIVAGKEIVPEFLQKNADPKKISKYILGLLENEGLRKEIKDNFHKIRESLGEKGASERAAQEVIQFLTTNLQPQ